MSLTFLSLLNTKDMKDFEKLKNDVIFVGPSQKYKSIENYFEIKDIDYNEQIRKNADAFNFCIITETIINYRLNNNLLDEAKIYKVKNINEVKKVLKGEFRNNGYPIFSGAELKERGPELKTIKKHLSIFFTVMFQMIDAGYLEKEDIQRIDDWIINFDQPVLRGFLRQLGIYTSAPDKPFFLEFLENPQFRQMLTLNMMKITVQFLINNDFVKETDERNWQDASKWSVVKEIISEYLLTE